MKKGHTKNREFIIAQITLMDALWALFEKQASKVQIQYHGVQYDVVVRADGMMVTPLEAPPGVEDGNA